MREMFGADELKCSKSRFKGFMQICLAYRKYFEKAKDFISGNDFVTPTEKGSNLPQSAVLTVESDIRGISSLGLGGKIIRRFVHKHFLLHKHRVPLQPLTFPFFSKFIIV